jgi:hypothetical protein
VNFFKKYDINTDKLKIYENILNWKKG